MRGWSPGQWFAAGIAAVVAALIIGVPTGTVETPFYTRMTPVLWWNYPFWLVTSVLSGLLVATYVAADRLEPAQQTKTLAGGLLSVFAVGCLVCNKLVVFALGVSGALTYFAPIPSEMAEPQVHESSAGPK